MVETLSLKHRNILDIRTEAMGLLLYKNVDTAYGLLFVFFDSQRNNKINKNSLSQQKQPIC